MVREVQPEVFVISRPQLDWVEIAGYLDIVGGGAWLDREHSPHDGETLVEVAGRLCYRSWDPGLNANVTKVREDYSDYLQNILRSEHGSVLEHAQYTFILHNVSRVFTHELVRHRVGVGISQESLRFVRLDDIAFWWPEWAKGDPELLERTRDTVEHLEDLQTWMANHFDLDAEGLPFAVKKAKTSFMRRFAPEGLATGLVWSANVRTLRWVVQARTAAGAEEEIRIVFDAIGQRMQRELPDLFGDFERVPVEDSNVPAWVPASRKV